MRFGRLLSESLFFFFFSVAVTIGMGSCVLFLHLIPGLYEVCIWSTFLSVFLSFLFFSLFRGEAVAGWVYVDG